jgi:SPP1 family predicted phage head-tail adaptor
LNAGELTKRITIQAETGGQDAYGQPFGTWTTIATVWGKIITSGGREFYAAQKLNAESTAVIEIRYRTNVTTANRILYNNRKYDILSVVDPEERHIMLQIACKEVI